MCHGALVGITGVKGTSVENILFDWENIIPWCVALVGLTHVKGRRVRANVANIKKNKKRHILKVDKTPIPPKYPPKRSAKNIVFDDKGMQNVNRADGKTLQLNMPK